MVELAREIRFAFRSENHKAEDEKEDRECLDSCSQDLEKDRDKDHGYFAIHDDTLPVVGA